MGVVEEGKSKGTTKNLLRVSVAALGGARNPHVQSVRSGFCAPSALHSNRSWHFLEVPKRKKFGKEWMELE